MQYTNLTKCTHVNCILLHVPMCLHLCYYNKKECDTMTKGYEQRKEANKKYLSTLDEIRIRVPKGKKEEYKAKAEAKGKSLNQYIIDCIERG